MPDKIIYLPTERIKQMDSDWIIILLIIIITVSTVTLTPLRNSLSPIYTDFQPINNILLPFITPILIMHFLSIFLIHYSPLLKTSSSLLYIFIWITIYLCVRFFISCYSTSNITFIRKDSVGLEGKSWKFEDKLVSKRVF